MSALNLLELLLELAAILFAELAAEPTAAAPHVSVDARDATRPCMNMEAYQFISLSFSPRAESRVARRANGAIATRRTC